MIVDQVNHIMTTKRGEIKEIESDDDEEDEQEEDIGIGELMCLCEKVEWLSLKYGDSKTSLDLSQSLRQFRDPIEEGGDSEDEADFVGLGVVQQCRVT